MRQSPTLLSSTAANRPGFLRRPRKFGNSTSAALLSLALVGVTAAAIMPAQADGGAGYCGGAGGADSLTGQGGAGGSGNGGCAGGAGGGGGAGVTGGNGGDGGLSGIGGSGGTTANKDGGDASGLGGGGGGAAGYFGTTLPINAATGGNGGRGGGNGSGGYASGSGGAGGYGAIISGTGDLGLLSSDLTGGRGGDGGTLGSSSGGSGGAGLAGSTFTAATSGTISGGNGGNGQATYGTGGVGGDGVTGSAFTITNNGMISGGDGGDGGNSDEFASMSGGGAGGSGIAGSALTITNNGVISGGTGGTGGTGVGSTRGVDGSGGAGIVGSNMTIVNAGTISGGLSGDGTTRANAITFTGGSNRLELQAGSNITGAVDAGAGNADTLALGGGTNGSFNVSQIGANAQYRGFEGFEKTGSGTWTLSGTTSAVTAWTIRQGTLAISSDGQLGNSAVALTFDGGTLQTTAPVTMDRNLVLAAGGGTLQTDNLLTLNGTVSGSGALTKTGSGTLALGTANSYSGGTTIAAGTIAVQATGALGTGEVTITGSGNKYNGIALSFENASAGDLTIANTGIGIINFSNGASAGHATIEQTGYGRMIFNAGTDAGTATLINKAGGVQFNGGSAGSAIIDNLGTGTATTTFGTDGQNQATAANAKITNGKDGRTLFFDASTAASATITNKAGGSTDFYTNSTAASAVITNQDGGRTSFHDNAIAGTARLVNDGGGLFDFTLTSGAAADRKISAGSIEGSGTFDLGANELSVGSNNLSTTVSGVIENSSSGAGNGSLVKLGTGTLTLNGANTYSGSTLVSGGRLVVGDDGHAGARLASAVTVATGATLGGIGTIGGLDAKSGGTVTPGNSIGTLSVAGDAAFRAGSTYQVEVDPNSAKSDKIAVTGSATIEGATLAVTRTADAPYQLGTQYTVLTAEGGVTGTYTLTGDLALSGFAGLAAFYDANNVYLRVGQARSFTSLGGTFNQRSTAAGLQSLAPTNALLSQLVLALPDETAARAAFDQLSGEIHASIAAQMVEDSRLIRSAAFGRLADSLCGPGRYNAPADPASGAACPAPDSFAVWGHAFGAWSHAGSDGNAASLSRSLGGFIGGIDKPVGDWRLGLLASYSRSSFGVDGRSSSASSNDYTIGAYGGRQWGALSLKLGAAYTWHDIETDRTIAIPGVTTGDPAASYRAATAQAFGELGYRLGFGAIEIEPFANLAFVHHRVGGFREEGGPAALIARSTSQNTVFSTLGLHAAARFEFATIPVTARATAGWQHAFGDTVSGATYRFAGGGAFGIRGLPIARDAALVEAGLDFEFARNTTLSLGYDARFARKAVDQSVKARLAVQF